MLIPRSPQELEFYMILPAVKLKEDAVFFLWRLIDRMIAHQVLYKPKDLFILPVDGQSLMCIAC